MTAAGPDDPAAFPGSRNQFAIKIAPSPGEGKPTPRRVRAALQMPPHCEEDGACDFGDTKIGKRPRTFAGTEAANLGGTGFPPAGLLGVSSRRLLDDARSGKAFLTMTCRVKIFDSVCSAGVCPPTDQVRTFTNGHCRALKGARLITQERRKPWRSVAG